MLTEIKEQVKEVIRFSQNIDNPKVDELIDNWYEAKKEFINAFGGFIYEVGDVEFHLTKSHQIDRVDTFIDRIVNIYGNYDLGQFVKDNTEGFFKNQVVQDYPNIPRGMKLVKAFKYFFDKESAILQDLQNEASRIIQEDKIKGTLCLSVHPLDYLSSSENTYNWRSCHSLDGDYRAGNLSYMSDKSTVICYVKTHDDCELPNFPQSVKWNSKKWRMLLYLSDDKNMVFAGRQYPFRVNEALMVIEDTLRRFDLFKNSLNAYESWDNYNVSSHRLTEKYIAIQGRLFPIRDIVRDKNQLHYNDLLYSSVYKPYYMYGINFDAIEKLPVLTVGGDVACLDCGQSKIFYSETMRCTQCELDHGDPSDSEIFGTCDCCGRHMLWQSAHRIKNDYYVCESCYQDECYTCPRCGEVIFDNDKHYDYNEDDYFCSDCIEDMNRR